MRFLLLLLPLACSFAPSRGPASIDSVRSVEQQAPPALFERVVVIGASLSSGFGLERETVRPTSFAAVFDATIAIEHPRVHNQAQPAFFVDPEGYGRLMVDAAKALKPTLVIALDFPFWFGYGSVPEEERNDRLRRGLRLLEEFDCPLVVGNFPDMSKAADGLVLSVIQVPSADSFVTLNQTIANWSASRADRILVDLDAHARLVRAKQDLAIGEGWPGTRSGELMQEDRLHPTLVGSATISVMISESLVKGLKGLKSSYFDSDIERVAKRVLNQKKPD